MANLFSGLEAFGLGKLSGQMEVYQKEDENKKEEEKAAQPAVLEQDIIFDKTLTCPVCDHQFKAKTVKTGKVKLLSADTDLRPKYQYVDSLKYDAILCPNCGYASLRRFFNFMTSGQAKLIKEQISTHFKKIETTEEIITYDDAINRHKLALVSTIVKRGKISEKAYTCLKTAWMYRGKAETLPDNLPERDKVLADVKAQEKDFTVKAYEGFKEAFTKETFPMCGMDEDTCTYLVADLARRCGDFDEASRWISRVLISRTANERIKERAREIKEKIRLQDRM